MNLKNKKSSLAHHALIIGGQPKAGTSSLHHWFSRHPEINPSKVKEPRFFLDRDYPIPSGARYTGDNGAEYLSFFREPDQDKILLDVSPDYLYCKSALEIADVLPNSCIVFILRDPTERAVSWYKYAAQMGYLSKDVNFEKFVEHQLNSRVTATTPIHERALEQNRVSKYVPPFQERFGERCLVVDFADMKKDPRAVVQRICAFAELDPSFFDTFDFAPRNVSTGERASKSSRIYYRTRAAFNYLVKPSPRMSALVRPLGLAMKKILLRPQKIEEVKVNSLINDKVLRHARSVDNDK